MVVLFVSLLAWDDDAAPRGLVVCAAVAMSLGHGTAYLLAARTETGRRHAFHLLCGLLMLLLLPAALAILLLS